LPALQAAVPICASITSSRTVERKLDRCQRIFRESGFLHHNFWVSALQFVVRDLDNVYSFHEAAALNQPLLAPGSASAMRETRCETHLVFSQRRDHFFGSHHRKNRLHCIAQVRSVQVTVSVRIGRQIGF